MLFSPPLQKEGQMPTSKHFILTVGCSIIILDRPDGYDLVNNNAPGTPRWIANRLIQLSQVQNECGAR
ncbi:hypothetical protein FJTKL_01665 [Diaporthe vaccinii]|uniref:Uncharacterized protein n=1 Tax=Diaporthe vaccinii TaxID=105482 RepID=A0ABR4DZZ2_9PEZI